ncbi:MAG: beta-ketoacyl-ACP synthase II, partial [Victivallales bacterium]|nr:beta-ketoacyl-ACP synthase II [Victivallales bacterium]
MDRRVVVTGIGALSCVGNSVPEFWDGIVNGKCGIDRVTRFDPSSYRTQMAGQIQNFDISKYMLPKEARRLDPFCQYAIAAADEAVESAGLSKDLEGVNRDKAGVIVSSGIGGIQTIEKQSALLWKSGPGRISPFLVPMMIADLASGNISMRYGAKGPNMAILTACATSTHSIGESYWMVRRGDADIMISGGAEAGVSPISFAGFCAMKAMSSRNDDPKTSSRPFDAERDGFVMSEGAGVLILEELEHAKARGANILAEISGYGASGDAHHITAPAPGGEGAVRAIRTAMNHAGIGKYDIDYINAHGTSTPLNDKFETLAYKTIFEENAKNIPISSIKGSVGHNLGAAGAIEIISCIKTI